MEEFSESHFLFLAIFLDLFKSTSLEEKAKCQICFFLIYWTISHKRFTFRTRLAFWNQRSFPPQLDLTVVKTT